MQCNASGFTLIEVLVSMVILAIGLLGLAAMQAISLRDNQDAYFYQQATLFAYEMQDRIRSNPTVDWASIQPIYNPNACLKNTPCTAQDLAKNDYGYWNDKVSKTLPAPKSAAKIVEITSSAQANTPCQKTHSTSLCLITRWGRANTNDSTVLVNDASFYLEITP